MTKAKLKKMLADIAEDERIEQHRKERVRLNYEQKYGAPGQHSGVRSKMQGM